MSFKNYCSIFIVMFLVICAEELQYLYLRKDGSVPGNIGPDSYTVGNHIIDLIFTSGQFRML